LTSLLLAAAAASATVLWWQRTPLLAWYCVRCLTQANEAEREGWAERIDGLEDAGEEALVSALARESGPGCDNTAFALTALGRRWGAEDGRTASLAARLANHTPRCGPAGQAAVLKVLRCWLESAKEKSAPPPDLAAAAGQALAKAAVGGSEVLAS